MSPIHHWNPACAWPAATVAGAGAGAPALGGPRNSYSPVSVQSRARPHTPVTCRGAAQHAQRSLVSWQEAIPCQRLGDWLERA